MTFAHVRRSIILLGAFALLAAGLMRANAQGDGQPLYDPMRPVMMLGRDCATIQWFTRTPCVTRLEIRKGELPCRTYGQTSDPWKSSDVKVLAGPPGLHTYHRVTALHLAPGTRYYYRCYDPGAEPTTVEQTWGAEKPWRREWAFSTLAPRGRKTIIRIPVKVLLMPNVVNVASAHLPDGRVVPPPPDLDPAQLARIREEYATAARFLFINNGMRVWYDFRIFVDARRQRWGPEPPNVSPVYKGWPLCRSYAGTDFAPPGGGDFTIVDTQHLDTAGKEPVREVFPYVGQIEQAFPRRWDDAKKQWVFYNSGGGTLGADDWARGIPGRSQFLGGGDTAWLATHEFHHQIEALGTLSFGTDENDRVIFDHFFPRRRVRKPDGTYDEWTWQTSWAHGEHWDGISYFDRLLTSVQWLRLMFGETITVLDADEDGVPDDDPRLPFDEKRFGSSPHKAATAGGVGDLARIQQSTWAPCPLTSTWNKEPYPLRRPKPSALDTDGDGIPDAVDPYPLYPWQPFVWPMTATVDGDPGEWSHIPLAGINSAHGVTIQFRQGHDDAAYYACFQMRGPWARVAVGLDGEGLGYYTTDSTYAFEILSGPGQVQVRPVSANQCPGMQWKAKTDADGETTVEIAIPNRGEGLWFWTGGGRPVGAAISLWTASGAPLSIYDPYHFFYARMLQRFGRAELPAGAPAELRSGPGVAEYDFSSKPPGSPWRFDTAAWVWRNHAMRFAADAPDTSLALDIPPAREFDLWAEAEALNDLHLGAWPRSVPVPTNMTGYVSFVGGFGNARSMIRAAGSDIAVEDVGLGPGKHTVQLTRRNGQLWLLYDGRPLLFARDPDPGIPVTRLGFLGGWGGSQAIYRVRVRLGH